MANGDFLRIADKPAPSIVSHDAAEPPRGGPDGHPCTKDAQRMYQGYTTELLPSPCLAPGLHLAFQWLSLPSEAQNT